jgi:hypothetical protein
LRNLLAPLDKPWAVVALDNPALENGERPGGLRAAGCEWV